MCAYGDGGDGGGYGKGGYGDGGEDGENSDDGDDDEAGADGEDGYDSDDGEVLAPTKELGPQPLPPPRQGGAHVIYISRDVLSVSYIKA